MLRKFAVALVAASLIAGPAFAQTNGPAVAAGQPATTQAKTTAVTPAVKKHVVHKRVIKKHVAKHHVKKVHASKVKHGKAVKRIKKPVDKTLG